MSGKWARQNEEPAVLAERRNVNKNVSLQTGEEFSMEFLRDHHTPKTHNDVHRFGDLYYQNQPVGYDSVARFHELRRIESECPSDAYDFGRDPGGYMPHFNAYHNVGGEKEVTTRKAFGETNPNQGGGGVTGRSAPSVYLPERSQSNIFTGGGGGDFDRYGKVKFLCSFGGKIMPRSIDEKLKYVGGETHIVSIRKNLSWEELKKKTSAICQQLHSIKYQLPGDELDSLISVSSDEDLQNMIEEYNVLERPEGSQRPRLFLIPIGEPETKAPQSTSDCQYVAAMNCNPRKIAAGGQTLASEASYHVNHLDRNPSFCKRPPSQMLRVDTTAMHSNPLFSGVQYNISAYPSPPMSPSPFQHRESNGGYSQFHGNNNSSSESNNSFSAAQQDPSSVETIDSRYHQQRPLPSANFQAYKQEAEQPYGIQFQSGFNKNLETPNLGHVDSTVSLNPERSSASNGRFYCEKVCIPEESKVSFSGSTNSNDSFLGLPHSYSDSTLEINGGQSSYFSQERQSPSSPLNFTKKQTQEKPVQVHRNNDLADRRTQSNILDLKSTDGGEPMFNFSPSPGEQGLSGENKAMHIEMSGSGSHYDEFCLNQETKNQGGKVMGTRGVPTDMECNKLPMPTSGNKTSVVDVDPWKQLQQDSERLIAGTLSASLISLEEGIAADASNQEPGTSAARERNLEVSGIFLNKRAGSDDDFLFNISSESANKQIGHEIGSLELYPTQNNVSPATIMSLIIFVTLSYS